MKVGIRHCIILPIVWLGAFFALGCDGSREDANALRAGSNQVRTTREIPGYGNTVILKALHCTTDLLMDLAEDSTLRSITFDACTFGPSVELLAELKHIENLQTLRLINCKLISPLMLSNLSIQNLEVSSDATTVVDRIPIESLRELRLSGVTLTQNSIADIEEKEGLAALILRGCNLPIEPTSQRGEFQAIRIDDCDGGGVSGFAQLKSKLKSLDGLTLSCGIVVSLVDDPAVEMLSLQRCKVNDHFQDPEHEWGEALQRIQLDLSDSQFPPELLNSILRRPKIVGLDVSGLALSEAEIHSFAAANTDCIISLDLGDMAFGDEWRRTVVKMRSLRFLVSTDAVRIEAFGKESKLSVSSWEANTDLWHDGAWR